MLLTLKAKLQPTTEQRRKLLGTMQTFNAACGTISREAYSSNTFNQYKLHHRLYHRVREQHILPAQLVVRAIGKVVESYKVERRHLHVFGPHGAIVYDQRIMSFKGLDKVSLATAWGRETIRLMGGGYARLGQRALRGQADLIYVGKEFYLCLVFEQPEAPPFTPVDYLGVDLGVVNLASTSDGVSYSGEDVEAVRGHFTEKRRSFSGWGRRVRRGS